MKWILPLTTLLALGLTACNTHKISDAPVFEMYSYTNKNRLESCSAYSGTEEWVQIFLLPHSLREEALSTVDTPDNEQQIWLRSILLTHNEASYRELQEAESLLLKQLKLSDTKLVKCKSKELLDYIIKLNRVLQKRKSEVVLLQRQLNDQNKKTKTQVDENAELQKKIEALTNIEHHMKQRSKKVKPEVSL